MFENPSANYTKTPMVITFDDGYKDFVEYAMPVLDKYKAPATMFVITNCVNRNLPPWNFILDTLFYHTNKLTISAFDKSDQLGQQYRVSRWETKQQLEDFGKNIKQYLKTVPSNLREEVVDYYLKQFNDVEIPDNLIMSWDDINSVAKYNIEIGSHTLSHPPLATITSDVELRTELEDSGKEIELRTGIFPQTVSYPVGSYNAKVKQFAKQAGYKYAYIVNQQIYNSAKYDEFEIPRLELYNESLFKTRLRVDGTIPKIKKLLGI